MGDGNFLKHLNRTIIINITASGVVYVNDSKVDYDELPQVIGIALTGAKEKMVIIKGDRAVPHGTVVRVMDMAKISGAERIVIATEPDRSGF